MTTSFVKSFFAKKEAYIPKTSKIKLEQDYQKHEKTLHLFCENEDDYEFYRHSINHHFSEYKIHHYSQSGKANVIKAYKEIDWKKYSRQRVLFFIDKDYDDLIERGLKEEASNLFITKYYSIENYLVTEEILRIILNRIYQIHDEKILGYLTKKFSDAYSIFTQQLISITSCILIFRKQDLHMNLDGLKLDSFFYFRELSLHKKKY